MSMQRLDHWRCSMRKLWTLLIAFLAALCVVTMAEASDEQETNRKLGYFDNTRTVLLLPARWRGQGSEAAAYVNRDMRQIFRYPYYRTLDGTDYDNAAVSPSELGDIADKTGADIVVMPVITEWYQMVFHRFFFDDDDPILQTRAVIDIYSYKKTDGTVRDDRSSYFNTEDESTTRNVYILDDMMKKIYKTFPYRRVPTDVSRSLTGDTTDNTPKTGMKN